MWCMNGGVLNPYVSAHDRQVRWTPSMVYYKILHQSSSLGLATISTLRDAEMRKYPDMSIQTVYIMIAPTTPRTRSCFLFALATLTLMYTVSWWSRYAIMERNMTPNREKTKQHEASVGDLNVNTTSCQQMHAERLSIKCQSLTRCSFLLWYYFL